MAELILKATNLREHPKARERMDRVQHWFGPFTEVEAQEVLEYLQGENPNRIEKILKSAMVYGWNSKEMGYELATLLEATAEYLLERRLIEREGRDE
jgi:hypothetical protein